MAIRDISDEMYDPEKEPREPVQAIQKPGDEDGFTAPESMALDALEATSHRPTAFRSKSINRREGLKLAVEAFRGTRPDIIVSAARQFERHLNHELGDPMFNDEQLRVIRDLLNARGLERENIVEINAQLKEKEL